MSELFLLMVAVIFQLIFYAFSNTIQLQEIYDNSAKFLRRRKSCIKNLKN